MSELDIRHLPNMVLNFDLRARYSASTKHGTEFRSQSSIFGVYRIWCWISISELDIRSEPNIVLNFDLRARCSVSTEYSAEFRSQRSMLGIYRIWCWLSISELDIRYLANIVLSLISELDISWKTKSFYNLKNIELRVSYSPCQLHHTG